MTAILGILDIKGSKEKNSIDVQRMLSTIDNGTSYSTGLYHNTKIGAYIGWATHKDSFSDCLPIYNEKKNIIFFFIGENFPVDHNSKLLKINGYPIDTTKAQYLVHLYETMGDDFFSELNGIFSGLVIDLSKEKVVLFNDRYGLHRVYTFQSGRRLIFSSKAGAISTIEPECRHVDYQSLAELISCRAVLENRSLFKNISLLPGGSLWLYKKNGGIKKNFYFVPSQWEKQTPLGKESYYEQFKELFPKITSNYINPNEKMMLSLTGGLDTRMILAAIDLQPGQLPTYTHGGMFNESFDVKIARKVADVCNQPHKTIHVGNDYLLHFPELAEQTVRITDGHLDVTESVGLYTSQIIKQNANIRLTGNYGSEILRSHVMFKHSMPRTAIFDDAFIKQINQAGQTYQSLRQIHPLTFIAFRQVPWYHYNRFTLEQSQIIQRSPYLDNRLIQLVYRAPKDATQSAIIPLRFVTDMHPNLGNIRTDRGVGNNDSRIKAISIKAYYEFLFKMDYYFNYGMPQWATKAQGIIFPRKLERIFLGRHKYHHFRVWYRDQLGKYVKEILLDPKTISRPFLNGYLLETIIDGHLSGKQNFTQLISMLLTTELFHRCFIDQ
jgi:asparagine synthase (glutamine-hydrolysing)